MLLATVSSRPVWSMSTLTRSPAVSDRSMYQPLRALQSTGCTDTRRVATPFTVAVAMVCCSMPALLRSVPRLVDVSASLTT